MTGYIQAPSGLSNYVVGLEAFPQGCTLQFFAVFAKMASWTLYRKTVDEDSVYCLRIARTEYGFVEVIVPEGDKILLSLSISWF